MVERAEDPSHVVDGTGSCRVKYVVGKDAIIIDGLKENKGLTGVCVCVCVCV